MTAARHKVRVLIVDDSAIARDILERGLSHDPGIEVVGKASDAWSARDQIVIHRPDVLTLDVEMPRMDGIEFLRRLLPQYPIPVVIVSAVTQSGSQRALEALQAGAVDVVGKPSASDREGLSRMLEELAERVKEAAHAKVGKIAAQSSVSETADLASHASHETQATRDARPGESARTQSHQPVRGKASALHKPRVLDLPERALVAIGASTGGTTVLSKLISQFPANMPPVVVVQHMPPVFTRMFAQSIDRESAVDVKEAEDGDVARPGLVLIAPGDFHLTVHKHGLGWRVALGKGGKVSGHRPSVDVLFHSVASAAGPQGIGVICTGMGSDGADGMLAMRHSGARCIAQDEDSSVVYGMPKEAWDNGAAEFQVGADRITETVLALLAAERKVRSH